MLPGLTFQHLDGHFHSGLRMAQAVSRGLHHLPKGPRAEGTSWKKMIPQLLAHQEAAAPPSTTLDLRCSLNEAPKTTVLPGVSSKSCLLSGPS